MGKYVCVWVGGGWEEEETCFLAGSTLTLMAAVVEWHSFVWEMKL